MVKEGLQKTTLLAIGLLYDLGDHVLDDMPSSDPPVAAEGMHDCLQELIGEEGRLFRVEDFSQELQKATLLGIDAVHLSETVVLMHRIVEQGAK